MTASTSVGSYYYPYYGRLNGGRGNGAWCPVSIKRTEYLQIDMGVVWSVCSVATQGEKANAEWTTSYKLQFSSDGATYNIYKENNADKVSNKLEISLSHYIIAGANIFG